MADRLDQNRVEFLKRDFSRGFIKYCGFEAVDIERGKVESSLNVTDHHRQQDGFVHAGVMAAMADHTAGYAGFTTVEDNRRILTVEFKINFLRPAFGQVLKCSAHVIRGGSNLIVAEADVYDMRKEGPVLCAKAMMTQAAVEISEA
ncbi:MAG TPA: PaaI family thioesterase [Desulfobacteraceae bacterium]|nr:PaaI family thioesterase [Desulfobacteraceae bacterium]